MQDLGSAGQGTHLSFSGQPTALVPADLAAVAGPGLIVGVLVVLILANGFYAFWPYRRRSYLPVLMLTAAGMVAGQAWDLAGLPALRLGSANLLPAVVFAAALQPFAGHLPIRFL